MSPSTKKRYRKVDVLINQKENRKVDVLINQNGLM